MNNNEDIIFLNAESSDQRIDAFLAGKMNTSRTKIAHYIDQKMVYKNNKLVSKTSEKVLCNDCIMIKTSAVKDDDSLTEFQNKIATLLNSAIIFNHNDFIVINKPVGISVHKSHKNDPNYTIADWIVDEKIWQDEIKVTSFDQGNSNRLGIVHRLDKNTSGLMILTKNYQVQDTFITLFKNHHIEKKYYAITDKQINWKDITIKSFILRDIFNPTKMITSLSQGKLGITHFSVIQSGQHNITLLECIPKTGRTHQIRVHAADNNFSLLGDEIYGTQSPLINRHALHAYYVSFTYNDETFLFTLDLPDDMKKIIE